MHVCLVYVHSVFNDEVLDELEEDFLTFRAHGSPIAEVKVQKAYPFGVSSVGHEQVCQFHRWIAKKQRCLVQLLLRARLVEQLEDILVGVFG